MPKAYFDPDNIRALAEVLSEAKHRLNLRDVNDPAMLDYVAARIFSLAAEGVPPGSILQKIAPAIGEVPIAPTSAIDLSATSLAAPDKDGA
ncbi:MAG: hypothetical protein ACOZAM_15850 [Pseudomonadota bacterium]